MVVAVALAALIVGCAKPDVVAVPTLIADSTISLGIEYELGDLAAAPDGGWWLLDTRNQVAAQFGADGTPRRRLGRGGEGPGEFRSPTLIGVTASGDVVISDIALRRLTVFSGDSVNPAPRLYATPPLVTSLMVGPNSGTVTLGIGGFPPRGPSLVTVNLSSGAALDTTWIWEAAPTMVEGPGEPNRSYVTSMLRSGAIVVIDIHSPTFAVLDASHATTTWTIPANDPPLVWGEADARERGKRSNRGPSRIINGVNVDLSGAAAFLVGRPKAQIAGAREVTVGGDDHLWCVRFDQAGFLLKRYDRQGMEAGSMRLAVEPTLLRPTGEGIVMVVEDDAGRVLLTRVRGGG
jgi:hypothetical protein